MDILDRIIALLGDSEQQNLTDYLNLNRVAFSEWKSGKSKSYRKYLIEIAEYFNVSIDFLVYGKEKSSPLELTDKEQDCLNTFNELSKDDQNLAIGFMKGLAAKYDHEAEAKENAS